MVDHNFFILIVYDEEDDDNDDNYIYISWLLSFIIKWQFLSHFSCQNAVQITYSMKHYPINEPI